jgi:trk system potassium uptake protein TrkH
VASYLLVQRRDLGVLCNIVGRLLILVGIVIMIPLPVCAVFDEFFAIPGFLVGALFSFSLGFALYLPFKDSSEARNKHGMIAAALCWIVTPMVGMVPFVMVTESIPADSNLTLNFTMLDSYFEAMSGWTGTGLTMVDNEELLPASIQFWRSLMQWVGGVGVIVLMLAILARPGTGAFSLYMGEARADRLMPRIVDTVRQMWKIFLIYTIAGILLLTLLGMPVWDSINHAMTALATGGFSVRDNSIGSYDNPVFEMALIPLMLIGAISFVVHYNLFKKRFRELIDDVQNKVLFALCIIGTILLTIEVSMRAPISNGILNALRLSSFQFVSAITCTGLQSTDVAIWSPSAKLVISLAMIAGGAAGSTVGGIKLVRLILITKGANWKFLQTFMPSGMYIPKKLGRAMLKEEEMSEDILEAATLSFMYLILLVIGLLVMMHIIGPTYSAEDVIFEVCSAQGNVGMSVGITLPTLSPSAKWMLIINMWAGRLEIFPVLMLLQSIFFYIGRRGKGAKKDVLGLG